MRQYIIAGNWKMNKTVSESIQLATPFCAITERTAASTNFS